MVVFYETLFKMIISKKEGENKILRNKQEFDSHKHDIGDFASINIEKCLSYGINNKWISQKKKDLIAKHNDIRNRIVHFCCGW